MNNNDTETNQDNLSRQQTIRLRQSDKKRPYRCRSSINFDRRSSRKRKNKIIQNNENINTDNTNASIFKIYSSNQKFNIEKDESDDKLNIETIYSNCCNFFEENNDIGKNKSNMNNPNQKNNDNRKKDFNFNYLSGYERYERLNEKLSMFIKKEIEDEEKTLLKKLDIKKNLNIKNVKFIGGVDTTYAGESELIGCAALLVFRKDNFALCYHEYFYGDFTIPYCPSYLNKREGNIYFNLLRDLEHSNETKPDVILVDGNGIIHTRGCGLATYFGIKIEIPTIGISKKPCNVGYFNSKIYEEMKKKLTKRGQSAPIYNNQKKIVGFLYKSTDIDDPIIINPGQLIDPISSLEIVKFCCRGHKLPEPIYYADKFTRIIMNNRDYLAKQNKLQIWNFEKAKDFVYEELKKYDNYPILNTEKEPFEENKEYDFKKNNENVQKEIDDDKIPPPYSPVISECDVKSNDEFLYESFDNNDENKILKNKTNISDGDNNKKEINKSDNIDINGEITNNKQNQQNNINIVNTKKLKKNLEEIPEENDINTSSKKRSINKEISEKNINEITKTQELENTLNTLINDVTNNKIIESTNENKNVHSDLKSTNKKIISKIILPSTTTSDSNNKNIDLTNENKNVLSNSQCTDEKIKLQNKKQITSKTDGNNINTDPKKENEIIQSKRKNTENLDERSYHSMYNIDYRKRKTKISNKQRQKNTDLFMNCKCKFKLTHDFRGIINIGNSCYINASIQLFYSCDIFYNLIVHSSNEGEIQTLLRTIFLEINSGVLPDTKKLIEKLGFPFLLSQDAQEAIQKILGTLFDEFANTKYQDVYRNLFTIGLHNSLICQIDNKDVHIHEKDENNITLQLPLGENLDKCFNIFSDDVIESFYCDKYNTIVKNLKQNIKFNFLPIYLIISLKRFTNRIEKNNKVCDIIEELDLNKYSTNNSTEKYLLNGIIIHKENKNGIGHYMYLLKHEDQDQNKTGILYNDDLVYYCNFLEVLNFCNGNNSYSNSESNYILLYKKINVYDILDNIESNIIDEITQSRPKLFIKNRYTDYKDSNNSYYPKIKPDDNYIDTDENIKNNNKIIKDENINNKNNLFYDQQTFLDIFSDKYSKQEDLKIFNSKKKESKFIEKIKNNQKKDKDNTIGLYEAQKNYDKKLDYFDMKISHINDKNSHYIRFDKLERDALEKELTDRTKKGCIIQTKRYWNYSIDYLEKKGSDEWNIFMKNFREMYGKFYIKDIDKDENGNNIEIFRPTEFKRNINIKQKINDLYNYYYFPFIDVDEFINFVRNETHDPNFTITKRAFNKFKYICPICITEINVENMTKHFLTIHYYSVHLIYWDDIGDRIEEIVNWQLTTKFERCIFYIKAFAGLFYLIYKYNDKEIKNESLLKKLSVMKHYINLDVINKLFTSELKESEAINTINICEILFCDYFEENLIAAKKKRVNKLYLDNYEKIKIEESENNNENDNNNKNKKKKRNNSRKKIVKNNTNDESDEVDNIDESESDSDRRNSRKKKENNNKNQKINERNNKKSYSKKNNQNRKKK